jgi:hypothetical protein
MYCGKDSLKPRSGCQKIFGLKRERKQREFWSEFDTKPVTHCIRSEQFKKANVSGAGSEQSLWPWRTSTGRQRKIRILKGSTETSIWWMPFIEDPGVEPDCASSTKKRHGGLTT